MTKADANARRALLPAAQPTLRDLEAGERAPKTVATGIAGDGSRMIRGAGFRAVP
jgi:hypothetical protein